MGQTIEVEVPTHVAAVLQFRSGCIGTMVMSFDVAGHGHPGLEIYGTEGSMRLPNPNSYGGEVMVRLKGGDWYAESGCQPRLSSSRSIGAAEMADAIAANRLPRANGVAAYHTLDIMCSILESSDRKAHVTVESGCTRPELLPMSEEVL
jgi:predicted dehydrogenase